MTLSYYEAFKPCSPVSPAPPRTLLRRAGSSQRNASSKRNVYTALKICRSDSAHRTSTSTGPQLSASPSQEASTVSDGRSWAAGTVTEHIHILMNGWPVIWRRCDSNGLEKGKGILRAPATTPHVTDGDAAQSATRQGTSTNPSQTAQGRPPQRYHSSAGHETPNLSDFTSTRDNRQKGIAGTEERATSWGLWVRRETRAFWVAMQLLYLGSGRWFQGDAILYKFSNLCT